MNKGKRPIDPWKAALAFHRQGKLARAEAEYWKVLLELSDDDLLLCNLGATLRGQGKFDQAVSCYRRAIAINPENWRVYGNLGNALSDLGDLEQAEASLRKSIELEKKSAEPHCSLGMLLKNAGKLEEAADCFRRVLDIRPGYLDASIALSAITETQGRTKEAQRILWDGVTLQPVLSEHCKHSPRARALLFRGVEDCRYKLSDDFQHKMSGGHFSTTELLHAERFTKHHFHIAHGNLDTHGEKLPPHDIIVNTIACPDREPGALKSLSRFLKGRKHAPLINAPKHVMQTTRNSNYDRFQDIEGITFPRTLRISPRGKDRQSVIWSIREAGMSFPVIMRRVGTQSAVSTQKLKGADDIDSYLDATEGEEFYVIQYVDCRFRKKYYRKLRLFCIDGRLYPVVCHIDDVWNVHGGNRKTLMKQNAWMQAEEKRFLEDFTSYIGPENRRRLESLHRLVKLDFYGIDFTIMDDKSILIYELNAAMRHSMVHAAALPYLTPTLNDISAAFEAMAMGKVAARQVQQ